MTILDTLLFGIVAALITLKIALLAAAAVLLLYSLTKHIRQRTVAPAPIAVNHKRLDEYA